MLFSMVSEISSVPRTLCNGPDLAPPSLSAISPTLCHGRHLPAPSPRNRIGRPANSVTTRLTILGTNHKGHPVFARAKTVPVAVPALPQTSVGAGSRDARGWCDVVSRLWRRRRRCEGALGQGCEGWCCDVRACDGFPRAGLVW